MGEVKTLNDIYYDWAQRIAKARRNFHDVTKSAGVSSGVVNRYKDNEKVDYNLLAIIFLIRKFGFEPVYNAFDKAGVFSGKLPVQNKRISVFLSIENEIRK